MKAAFLTLGCRYNQSETAEMKSILEGHNIKTVPFDSRADIYIINTCTVTSKSDYKSRQAIRMAKNKNTSATLIVTGCYPQVDPEGVACLKGVDIVLGNMEKSKIYDYVKEVNRDKRDIGLDPSNNKPKIFLKDIGIDSSFDYNYIRPTPGRTRVNIKIQSGCNLRCSYCIVRLARGTSKSAPLESVVANAKALIKDGVKEIVLTGIHIGSYGKDLNPPSSLVKILSKLIKIDGEFRIRLSSITPRDITPQLIEIIASTSKICNHLHIPLQSGDSDILRRMKRDYDAEGFEERIWKLKEAIVDIGIGTDVMVGFPGEKDSHFNNTASLIKRLPFSYMHVFRYSPRQGTEAYDYADQISELEKKARAETIEGIKREKVNRFRDSMLGKFCDVLFEGKYKDVGGSFKGYTDNYLPVIVRSDDNLSNKIVKVALVKRLENDMVEGRL